MADDSAGDKTEDPTSKRRSDSRGEGNVAKSQEINAVIVLLMGVIMLRVLGRFYLDSFSETFLFTIGYINNPPLTQEDFISLFVEVVARIGKMVLPLSLAIMVSGVLSNIFQIGWLVTFKPLQPKFEKINPLSGFKRLFSIRSFVELIKNLFKLTIIGFVAYKTIAGEMTNIMLLNGASIGGILMLLVSVSFKILMRIVMVLMIMAILDYAYQKYEHEKKLKMSKQEVKEERKQQEGDPVVKRRIRQLQMEMARRRMMQEVPKATVVVTNPTYIAIAIRYEPEENETPVVLAKGKRLIAEKIKKLAIESKIPIVEDKPLARAMYDKVDIGQDIPMEFFTAVAEIMAYVFKLQNRTAA